MQLITTNEGFSGYVSWKTGIAPIIKAREFVFEIENENVTGELETGYERDGYASVQRLTVRNGNQRRRQS